MTTGLTVAIAVPLQEDLVTRIGAVDPSIRVLYEPELLPPERYPSDHRGDPDFRRSTAGEARYWQMVDSADILYGFPGESADGLARAATSPRLAWIHATASGAGSVVRQAGLTVVDLSRLTITTSAGVHALPLAEFAVMGVLAGLKRLPELARDQAHRHWPAVRVPMKSARGARLVVAGLGEIGAEAARIAHGMGLRVSGTRRTPTPVPGVERVGTGADLAPMLADADAVITTLPSTPFTDGLFDDDVFAAMAPGTVLVNVGRGSVIDEEALLRALDAGRVSFACLDVFAVEPLPADSPLWGHPRVLISPHSATMNVDENELLADRFCANLRRFLDGEPLPHTVDPVHFY